jgi:predicted nucleotidyltransferase
MTEAVRTRVLEMISAWAERYVCIERVYIFGSFARGDPYPNDIDVAVWFTEATINRNEVMDYTAAQASSEDLADSILGMSLPKISWTGMTPFTECYDFQAWRYIRAGREVRRLGNAALIYTDPKPANPLLT